MSKIKIQNEISIGSKIIVTAIYLPTYNKTGTVIQICNGKKYKIFFKNESDNFHYYRSEFKLLENGFAFQNTVFCKWCHKKINIMFLTVNIIHLAFIIVLYV